MAIRWLTYVSLSTSIGCVVAHLYLRAGEALGGERANQRILARWGGASCVALLLLAGARLWAQWRTLGGAEAGPLSDVMRPLLLETFWGAGLIGQAVLAALAALAFAAVPRRGTWASASLATVLLSVTPALSGHAVAEARPALGVALDTVHVLAGGVWLGTLIVLVLLAVPLLRDAAARVALHGALVRFSRVALGSAAVLTLTGVYAAWVHVGSWSALWSTPYGDALVLKLGAVALAAGLGAINWRVAVPRLTLGGVQRFGASGTAEVLAALLIYLLTAVLVGRPLPADAAGAGAASFRTERSVSVDDEARHVETVTRNSQQLRSSD